MTRATREDAWTLLVSQPVLILATTAESGRPHLVPITCSPLDSRRIVSAVDAKPKATRELRRLENIRRDGRVSLLAHHYEDDWSRLWWVRADGTASVTETAPPGSIEALRSRYPQYADHVLAPWIVVEVERLSAWAAGKDPGRP